MLARRGLQRRAIAHEQLGADEWWLPDLADKLHVPANKLRDWVVRGWVNSRKSPGQGLWIVWADTQERKRLLRLSAQSKRGIVSYPAPWTTPKKKR